MTRLRSYMAAPLTRQAWHAAWAAAWAGLFWPAMTVWRESVPFLMFVSMATALSGSLAGVTAAIGARKADQEDPL